MDQLAPEDVQDWSDVSTSSLAPGARLGRYELLLPIAYGGMARVWAAQLQGQRGFSKLVVIKTILPHLAHSAEFERMFLDEARIAAGVHHPNVCEIYELGEEGNVLYLCMEWVNGDSLMHVLRGMDGKSIQPIETRIAARLVADACAGVHAAHELTDDDGRLLNVVHRDVSPHNVLVSLEGTVKVTDFGVAKALGQSHQDTVAGQIKGKIAYMSPEQIAGTAVDRRSDLFAMGVVLYEITTGVRPFRGTGDPQVMQAILKGTYDPPGAIVKGYPPELAGVIDRALAPEPRLRFATAERMRVALEEWLAKSGQVVTATQVGTMVRQRLGAALDKRREHVKAAMALLPGSEPGRSAGARVSMEPTPAPPHAASHSGQSHSGVVTTAAPSEGAAAMLPPVRGRSPSLPSSPGVPPPLPVSARGQTGLAAAAPLRPSPPSGARYVVAAVAGVVFAVLIGAASLLVLRARPGNTTAIVEPVARPAVPIVAPPLPATAIASTLASSPLVPPSASAPPPAGSARPATSTVDVRDLPTARPAQPTWTPAPSPRAPAASAKATEIPANPY